MSTRYTALVDITDLRIAITGATGFLGRYLVDTLAKRGALPIAVVRDAGKAARVLGSDVPVRIANLDDRAALTRAFEGVDAVISNAAVISFRSPRETLRTNVEGTRNVFEALVAARVPRAIAISSSSAYVQPLWPRTLDESAPLRKLKRAGFVDAYGVSKAEAERIAWQLARAGGVALTTFRPCGISGPADPLLMTAIARVASLPVTPFPVFTEIGVVHAQDVAEAVARALERPEIARDKAYNLQGNTVTLWQLADAWRNVGGTSTRLRLPVPCPISLRYDDARARRELAWQPRPIDAIVQEAVRARRSLV